MVQTNDSEHWHVFFITTDPKVSSKLLNKLKSSAGSLFETTTAGGFQDALTAFDPNIHDLILVEHHRDGASFFNGLKELRKIDTDTPIIIVSDDDKPAVLEVAIESGIQGFLPLNKADSRTLVPLIRVTAANARELKKRMFHAERYKNFIENMEDAYYETDLKGNYTYLNKEAATHYQLPRDKIVGMSYKEVSPKAVHAELKREYSRVFQEGKSGKLNVVKLKQPDGSYRYVETSIHIRQDINGKAIGFCGISRDITGKIRAENDLTKSEERYRDILTSIGDGYFETDLRGRFTFFNDSLVNMMGYSREELFTLSARDYVIGKDGIHVYNVFKKVFETGIPEGCLEYRLRRKDGGIRYLQTSLSLKEDDDGNIVGYRGLGVDVTERKLFEQELRKAKEGAEEASLAKSEFLANMSHEIRTPMNGIIGMYNLLLSTEMTDEQIDFVKTGKRSAESLLNVINDILDFSKIEAGKLDMEVIDFDLRKLVGEMVMLPAMQAQNKGLEFVYEIENGLPGRLKGDPGRLRQVIMNLFTNAIKFTGKGEIVLRVNVEKETSTNAILNFSVSDTGIGISEKDQALLFSSFHQVDSSTTRKYGGTGLGLAISRRLVELMGGQISVESETGQGTTFRFSIPFRKQEKIPPEEFPQAETIRDKRILIVDDSQTNLNILSKYLEYWGCTSDQALSAQMALSLMRAVAKAGAPYDIVITDLVMPEMDGAELGRAIKEDPELQDAKLVMLTSQGLRGDAALMNEIGFSGYLSKPVRRSLLYDCLLSVISELPSKKDKKKKNSLVTSHTVSESKRRNLNILLAEDNLVNQKLALHLLRSFGFEVDTVNNGKEAVEALKTKDYQVVLMDVQMPDMDGLEATKLIRKRKSGVLNRGVLIIAMTAHAMKGDRKICLDAGMNDYISKPINPEALLSVIEKNIKDFD